MKKRIIILTVVLLLVLSVFAACKPEEKEMDTTKETTEAKEEVKEEETEEVEEKEEEMVEEKFQSRKISFLSIWAEDRDNGLILTELSKQYAETVEGFEWDFQFIDITQLDTQFTVLLASDNLPDIAAYESGVRLVPVIESGKIIDVDKVFTELGIRDVLDDGAVSLLETLNGIGLYDVPLGLNVEGFWYNKALYEEAGITETPKTWDEFMDACDKLKASGTIPIVQGGKDKWPMSRVLNAYLVRSVGLNAVEDAMTGTNKWSDPDYVAAAQMFADMATNGYFPEGMNTIDYTTAANMLMGGEAATLYNGSWFTGNLNTDENPAGAEGIGFFNVPLVNDTSTLDDYSMNCGNILVFSQKLYDQDEALGDWLKFVMPKVGDYAMQNLGSFKGFKISEMPSDTTHYTQIVADALSSAKGSFLWFEAKMDSKTSTLAGDNIALLYTGEMSPEEFMQELEDSAAESEFRE